MADDDSRMDPLFEKCAELGLPVNLHVAEPKWMYEAMDSTNDGLMNASKWEVEMDEDVLDHAQMMDVLEKTVKRHPNTIFIACHFANCSYDLSIIGNFGRRPETMNLPLSNYGKVFMYKGIQCDISWTKFWRDRSNFESFIHNG